MLMGWEFCSSPCSDTQLLSLLHLPYAEIQTFPFLSLSFSLFLGEHEAKIGACPPPPVLVVPSGSLVVPFGIDGVEDLVCDRIWGRIQAPKHSVRSHLVFSYGLGSLGT